MKKRSRNAEQLQPPPIQDGACNEYMTGDSTEVGLIDTQLTGQRAVQYSLINGQPIYEGDIVLKLVSAETRPRGVVIPFANNRWANGQVAYDIDPNLPNQARVTDAIRHIERNTRVRFVLRTASNASQFPDFIHIQRSTVCNSSVGRIGGQQNINLADGCGTGSTIHEISHALGLWHEQSREDRDNFVTINWANIQPGEAHNFNQHITDGDDVGPYDYHSIMHYSRTAFGIDDRETITPRGGQQIGQRDGLSPGDCQAIRFMYRNLEGAGVFSGVQFTATLAAGATGRWFTHSWPAQWYVWWTIVPTAPAVDGPAQIEWKVAVSRQSGGLLKYHLIVTNVASYSVSFEARYDGLSWSTSAT